MKLKLNKKNAGHALLVALLITTIIGINIASYLILVNSQNRSVMRSLTWNSVMALSEAGVEEALTHLNVNGTNIVGNGWSIVDGKYTTTRNLNEGTYTVTITPDTFPIIECTGTLTSMASVNRPQPIFAVIGGNVQVPAPSPVSRTVRVATTNSALFAKALSAKGLIDLNGSGVGTDSFDSSDTRYSTGGRYDSTKTRDNGDVATNSGLTSSVNVGNADIKGRVSTGPGGSVAIGPNGIIGSTAWHASHTKGIEPGRTNDDMNVAFPDVAAPFSTLAFSPTSGTVSGVSYDYVVASGNYQMSSLSMSGNSKLIVTGNAVLYVTGNVSLSGNAVIQIAAGASLRLYTSGSSVSIGGNGITNPTFASAFYLFCMPTTTSVSMSGNAAFTGVLYAPQAAVTFGGGGNNSYDFVGACVANTVTMNGHFNFHYDESLNRIGPRRGYVAISWQEI